MKKLFALLIVICLAFPLVSCNSRNAGLCTYKIRAEYLDNGVISASMTFSYVCDIDEGTDYLKFNLFPNAFRKGAKITPMEQGDEDYGEIKIISVKDRDGDLNYEICGSDENVLKVDLGKVVTYGDKTEIVIDFGVILPEGDYRLAKGESTVNVGNWYPVLCVFEEDAFVECEYGPVGDPFYQNVANYEINLTVPSETVVASSGKATSCDVDGNKTSYSYSLSSARDFAFCLSEKFEIKSKKSGNTTVNYYYYNDENADKTLDVVVKAMDYFSDSFGEYPYETFSVAESNFNAGGMEYTGLVYVNDSLNEVNTLYTAVHETAHQWWYGVVGNNQLDEAYLDEGLTEYSTAIFFDDNADSGVDAKLVFKNARKACAQYVEILSAIGENPDNKMVKNLKDFSGEFEYVNVAYNRGLTMMKTLEDTVSRRKVKGLLAKYYKKHKFGIVTTEDFLSDMGKGSKILSAFIDGKAAF